MWPCIGSCGRQHLHPEAVAGGLPAAHKIYDVIEFYKREKQKLVNQCPIQATLQAE